MAILLPKGIGADSLARFRPIAMLPAIRKLLGYIWMEMLPALRFVSIQTGFIPRSHAAAGVFMLKRAAELSKEWGRELYVVQVDLCKAFDRVKHTAGIQALKLQGASLQCVAVFCMLMRLSAMCFNLAGAVSDYVDLMRGLPQGAPES